MSHPAEWGEQGELLSLEANVTSLEQMNGFFSFFDPGHLAAFALGNPGRMALKIYRITNAEQVDPL